MELSAFFRFLSFLPFDQIVDPDSQQVIQLLRSRSINPLFAPDSCVRAMQRPVDVSSDERPF